MEIEESQPNFEQAQLEMEEQSAFDQSQSQIGESQTEPIIYVQTHTASADQPSPHQRKIQLLTTLSDIYKELAEVELEIKLSEIDA